MTKEKISLNPVQKGLTNMAEIVNLLSRVLTSNPLVQSGAVAQTRSSSNPFAQNGGNPFVTSNPFANYGQNKPVAGGYFAGYYNNQTCDDHLVIRLYGFQSQDIGYHTDDHGSNNTSINGSHTTG